ncbi:hypothetical protein BDZ94DRAFT_943062 [Collybia nuda]|uniref:Uncharacterized protein n=1 Tax=Collybia nuda TaxID=64659 RepID=A0A9P5Y0S4_9AGAR|nr:hypothetical protein BDZ94DRAFT_943062 [Collybia nuda]
MVRVLGSTCLDLGLSLFDLESGFCRKTFRARTYSAALRFATTFIDQGFGRAEGYLLVPLSRLDLSPTTLTAARSKRSASFSSIASTLHATGFRGVRQDETTDSPSSTQSTPPLLSSSWQNSRLSSREFFRDMGSRSIEQLRGSSLKIKKRDHVQVTPSPQSVTPQSVPGDPRNEHDEFHHTRLISQKSVCPSTS